MKKRRIIILCSVIAVLTILIGTISALFNLKHIYIEVLSNKTIVQNYNSEDIIASGEFPYGSNVLFTSYTANKDKIEKAYPFVKVDKIVRRFPNKMTIYISGREPELVVEDSNKANTWYIVDIDMKVLAVISSTVDLANELYYSLPIVSGAGVTDLSAGDFIQPSIETNCMIEILDGIYGESASPSSVMSDITIDKLGEKCIITLDDRGQNGATISISGFANMKEKVFTAYHHYRAHFENDDELFPNKSDIDIIVGANFVPGINETITVHDRRDDV